MDRAERYRGFQIVTWGLVLRARVVPIGVVGFGFVTWGVLVWNYAFHRANFVMITLCVFFFFCRHTEIHQSIRDLPRDTVGVEIRKFLYEDIACLVEDFLFSRTSWCCYNCMAKRCLLEDDFDGVTYIFHFHVRPFHYAATFLELDFFRSALSVNALAWLCSFGPPTLSVLISTFLCAACEGRVDLIQFLCQTLTVPRELVELAVGELRWLVRERQLFPLPADASYMYYGQVWYYEALHSDFLVTVGEEVLRERRGQCIEFLVTYRHGGAFRVSDVSSQDFFDALRLCEEGLADSWISDWYFRRFRG